MTTATLLVFARCTGFVFRAPGISHPSVPRPVRAGLAFVLAAVIAPGIHSTANLDGIALAIALAVEALTGAAIGIASSLLYDAAYAAGRAVDDYVGVKAMAPSIDVVAPSGYGRLWSNLFTAGFFLLGAYRPVLAAFGSSFDRIPPGMLVNAHDWTGFAVHYASTILLVSLGIAAPAIALIFVVQVTLGALSRAIPRFGSVTLAFPLVFAAAIVATAIAAPLFVQQAAHPVLSLP